MSGIKRSVAMAVGLSLMLFSTRDSRADAGPIALGEVTGMLAASGMDATVVRDAAASELGRLDISRLPRRKVVVSIAVIKTAENPKVACNVNAMIRDARTGAMIAIIESGAQAEGPGSTELRKEVASAAVRSAVRRIPRALGAN